MWGVKISKSDLTLLSCQSGNYFMKKISNYLNEKKVKHNIREVQETKFRNSEYLTEILSSIRNDNIYIVQNHGNYYNGKSIQDDFWILNTLIQASHYADAKEINVIVPYYPYCRQDRKQGRQPISAKLAAQIMEMAGGGGLERVLTIDLHNERIEGFFDKTKCDNLHASDTIIKYLREQNHDSLKKLSVVSPDVGGTDRARHYARVLGGGVVFYNKKRDKSRKIDFFEKVGDFKNTKNVILVDDMIDSGRSMVEAVEQIQKEGLKDIYMITTFPLFTNKKNLNEFSRLYDEGTIKKVIETDAIYHPSEFFEENPWYQEISVAPLFGEAIKRIYQGQSLSNLLD
jgi:ribose-phosphate pyrophosphokinase